MHVKGDPDPLLIQLMDDIQKVANLRSCHLRFTSMGKVIKDGCLVHVSGEYFMMVFQTTEFVHTKLYDKYTIHVSNLHGSTTLYIPVKNMLNMLAADEAQNGGRTYHFIGDDFTAFMHMDEPSAISNEAMRVVCQIHEKGYFAMSVQNIIERYGSVLGPCYMSELAIRLSETPKCSANAAKIFSRMVCHNYAYLWQLIGCKVPDRWNDTPQEFCDSMIYFLPEARAWMSKHSRLTGVVIRHSEGLNPTFHMCELMKAVSTINKVLISDRADGKYLGFGSDFAQLYLLIDALRRTPSTIQDITIVRTGALCNNFEFFALLVEVVKERDWCIKLNLCQCPLDPFVSNFLSVQSTRYLSVANVERQHNV